MTIPEMLEVLRNPDKFNKWDQEQAQLMAADMIEESRREKDRWRMMQHEGWRHG